MTHSETTTDPLQHPLTDAPATSTGQVARILHFIVPEPEVVLPVNTVRIGDYVAESEKDESWRDELAKARAKLADALFSDQPTTIRTLRLRRGLSQSQLAVAIRTSQSHIARIELGRTDPNYDTLKKLAAALGADIGDVVKAYGAGKDQREQLDAAL